MARLFSWRPALTIRGREFRGIRGWSGKPTHPPLTDFPVVCYMLAGLFDVISLLKGRHGLTPGSSNFYRAGTYVIVVGAVVSLGTALTGFWDWLKSMPKHTQAWRTANSHMAIMLTVTGIVIVDIILRLSSYHHALVRSSPIVTALSVVAAALVGLGSFYGGSMVYDYAFNVEQDAPVWEERETDVFPADKKHPPAS